MSKHLLNQIGWRLNKMVELAGKLYYKKKYSKVFPHSARAGNGKNGLKKCHFMRKKDRAAFLIFRTFKEYISGISTISPLTERKRQVTACHFS